MNIVTTTLLGYTLASNLQNLSFIGSGDFTGIETSLPTSSPVAPVMTP